MSRATMHALFFMALTCVTFCAGAGVSPCEFQTPCTCNDAVCAYTENVVVKGPVTITRKAFILKNLTVEATGHVAIDQGTTVTVNGTTMLLGGRLTFVSVSEAGTFPFIVADNGIKGVWSQVDFSNTQMTEEETCNGLTGDAFVEGMNPCTMYVLINTACMSGAVVAAIVVSSIVVGVAGAVVIVVLWKKRVIMLNRQNQAMIEGRVESDLRRGVKRMMSQINRRSHGSPGDYHLMKEKE